MLLTAVMILGEISVRWAARSLSVTTAVPRAAVRRGEQVTVEVSVRHRCPLPVGPFVLSLTRGPAMEPEETEVPSWWRAVPVSRTFCAAHTGVCHPGAGACTVTDLFGLFEKTVLPAQKP